MYYINRLCAYFKLLYLVFELHYKSDKMSQIFFDIMYECIDSVYRLWY